MALTRELEVYKAKLPQLLADQGKFVVIFQDEIIGTFEAYSDALKAGYEKAKLEPFLVRKIAQDETVAYISRLAEPCPV